MISDQELERKKGIVSYLSKKGTLNQQESFDYIGAMIVVLFSRIEHLEKRVAELEARARPIG